MNSYIDIEDVERRNDRLITTINNVTITVSSGGSSASPVAFNYYNNYAYFNESVVPSLYVFNVDVTIHGTSYLSSLQVQFLTA